MNLLLLSLAFLTVGTTGVLGGYGGHSSSEEHGHGGGRPRPGGPPGGRGRCPNGWLRFRRPTGIWCVMVGHAARSDGMFSKYDAQAKCQEYGATLTGFQNSAERMAVANEGLKHIAQLKKLVGGLWVGATENAGCTVATCGTGGIFSWSDGETTGQQGFTWGVGEPDTAKWPGGACIQQIIAHPSFFNSNAGLATWRTHYRHGDLDRYQCGTPAGPAARIYACGKPGTR